MIETAAPSSSTSWLMGASSTFLSVRSEYADLVFLASHASITISHGRRIEAHPFNRSACHNNEFRSNKVVEREGSAFGPNFNHFGKVRFARIGSSPPPPFVRPVKFPFFN